MQLFNIQNAIKTFASCSVVANVTPGGIVPYNDNGVFSPLAPIVQQVRPFSNSTFVTSRNDIANSAQFADWVACNAFLDNVYTLVRQDKHRAAAAEVMDFLDNALLSGNTKRCDMVFRLLDVQRLKHKPTVLLAFLSITAATDKNEVPARVSAFLKIRKAISLEIGETRTADVVDRFK